jgi:hypothetical protein
MRTADIAYISREIGNSALFSSQGFGKLSEALEDDVKVATRIIIVSGYFGAEYILKLLEKPTKQRRAKCTVKIILGYDNTTEFVYGKVKEEALRDAIVSSGYKSKRVTVRLFKDSVPLHTKLYGFLRTTTPIWYVGSANASSAIEGRRHELMFRVSGRSEALEKYIDALLMNQSSGEQTSGGQIKAFQEYLGSGSLVFKPTRYRRFTYDAFSINPTERKKISDQLGKDSRVPHSDPAAKGFGFNLLSALGIDPETKEEKAATLRFRRYCVETAYGYWVPMVYVRKIEEALANSRASEEGALKKILVALAAKTDSEIIEEFQNYKSSAEAFFERLNVKAIPKKDLGSSFQGFLNVRRAWLNDAGWIRRNASKITVSRMPEIWLDEIAAEAFITSFIDDLVAVLNAPGQTPLIYRVLQKNFHIPTSPDVKTVREILEKPFRVES